MNIIDGMITEGEKNQLENDADAIRVEETSQPEDGMDEAAEETSQPEDGMDETVEETSQPEDGMDETVEEDSREAENE